MNLKLRRRMPGMGERAYAYAKACGIIGKSFVGKRISRLENISRLSELDRTVFPATAKSLPEKELLVDLEGRIIERAVHSIIAIVDCFSAPPEFLALLIRGYEYADLKAALVSSLEGDKAPPEHTDIGRFQTVRFDKWPDIQAMIGGTEFDFLLDKKGALRKELNGIALQTVLDRRYYSALWKSLFSLPGKERIAAARILSDEISLRNSGWALRLRSYYEMSPDEAKLHLMYIRAKGGANSGAEAFPADGGADVSGLSLRAGSARGAGSGANSGARKARFSKTRFRSLADEAISSLDFPLDNFAAWSSWRWKEFLNPESGYQWRADPRHFQNAASRHLSGLARHYFRLNPFSLDTVFCFIKLKQYEEDILTSNAEGLTLGMSGRDIFSMLGVEA